MLNLVSWHRIPADGALESMIATSSPPGVRKCLIHESLQPRGGDMSRVAQQKWLGIRGSALLRLLSSILCRHPSLLRSKRLVLRLWTRLFRLPSSNCAQQRIPASNGCSLTVLCPTQRDADVRNDGATEMCPLNVCAVHDRRYTSPHHRGGWLSRGRRSSRASCVQLSLAASHCTWN
jgi:hypothetical protein